jgi:hypothetical protein
VHVQNGGDLNVGDVVKVAVVETTEHDLIAVLPGYQSERE